MKPDLGGMMQQVQKMQEDMKRAQDALADITVEGSAGGGMVTVTANCQSRIIKVQIEPEVIDSDDKEMLEDLIVAAINQALEAAGKRSQEEMQKSMGPLMNMIPGGFKLPGM